MQHQNKEVFGVHRLCLT